MTTTLLALTLLSALAAAPDSEARNAAPGSAAGTRLNYQGTFESVQGEPEASRKTFELSLIVHPADRSTSAASQTPASDPASDPAAAGRSADSSSAGALVYWILREDGFGGWPWTDRFGRFGIGLSGQVEGHLPSLLYEREAGASPVSLPSPVLETPTGLSAGKKWTRERLEFEVAEGGKVAERATWEVRVTDPYGPKKTVWLDKETGLLVGLRENITIGQGERHVLNLELAGGETPTPSSTADRDVLDKLIQLRGQLAIEPRTRRVDWNAQQLAVLRAALPTIAPVAASAPATQDPVSRLVNTVLQDAKEQKGRDSAVAVIKRNLLNQPLPAFPLQTLTGEPFDFDQLKDKVTVLHFWEYRDTPLEEPYGQVGYVDFLSRQRMKDGVAVYGVAVDEKLADPEKRAAAIRSAKKLRSFMRLSYPLLLDTGAGLKGLGDPRASGAKLPLFVVIDRQGKVIHYHVGFYPVDQRRGLAELDEVVSEALKATE